MRVLLVPASFEWVEGTIAKQVTYHITDTEFLYATGHMPGYDPNGFMELIEQVDVVHWLMNLSNIPKKVIDVTELNIPSVASVYHELPGERKVKIANKADIIHTMSSEWQLYVKNAILNPQKAILAPVGINTDTFHPKPNKREGLFGDKDYFHIGMFANVSQNPQDRKGLKFLNEIMRRLGSERIHFRLCLTGNGWNDYRASYSSSNIEIVYKPFLLQKLMPTAYHSIDMYLICSKVEGGPVTALEAMACGIPVISTPVGMAQDAIINGYNGFLVPYGNVERVVELIIQIVQDKELRRTIGTNARETVRNNYSWQTLVPKYQALYKAAIFNWEVKNQSAWERNLGKPIWFRGKIFSPDKQRRQVAMESKSSLCRGLLDKHPRQALRLLWQIVTEERSPIIAIHTLAWFGKYKARSLKNWGLRLLRQVRLYMWH